MKGIILAGGGSMLANLDILIKEKTGLPVALAEDPLTCVVRGSGKVLQDIANTICQMVVGWRMGDDYERIAGLPDGRLSFDLLRGTVVHSSGISPELWVAGELSAWLAARLLAEGIPESEVRTALLDVSFRTDRIKTNRKKIVSFDFECRSVLETTAKKYEGKLVERHSYHQRIGA